MPEQILSFGESPTQFPYQKKPDKKKTKEFFKECVNSGINLVNFNHNLQSSKTIRSPRANKITNYKIYNGDIDPQEVERVVNPFRIQFGELPSTYRNYPLINPNIEVLLGEERKRFFKPMFYNINEDASTQEIERINEEFINIAVEQAMADVYDEQAAQKELQRFEKWVKYNFKDQNTRMSNQVIDYLYRTLNLKEEYSRGFEALLIVAEEIYSTDIIAGEPVQWKENPLNVFTLRSGDSYKIEESDIITIDGYMPLGQVIDRYHEYLSEKQIDSLEKGHRTVSGPTRDLFSNQLTHSSVNLDAIVEQRGIGSIISANADDILNFGGTYDTEGNIRVTRVLWKGMRKIGVKEYWDETGNYVKEFVPEQYEVKKELGENVEWLWVSEWYEGTRIGTDIYVKMGPREVQMRSMENPSKCHPGVVGTVVNVNNSMARSMVDGVKVYQYLYNAIMYKTESAMAKYLGKVGTINSALIPDGWNMDQFLYYMYTMNLKFEDPFNEGQRGAATGKLAGNMSQGSKDSEIGDAQFIQQHLMMLDFIQRRVDESTGITPQRKGAIDNRETVGGVERSVMQSSHITEKWFSIHDDTRRRALLALLETAKVAWGEKSFKRAYILDDGTRAFLDFSGKEFMSTEFGGVITTDSEDMNMMQAMKQLSQPMIQNGAPISLIMDLYKTKDPGDLQRKIEQFEQENKEEMQQMQQAEQEAVAAQAQQEQELEMMKLDIEQMENELDRQMNQYKIDRDNDTRIAVAQINAYRHQEDWDRDGDGTPDPMQIGEQAIKRMDVESKHFDKQQEIKVKKEIEQKKMDLEEKKMQYQLKLQKQKDEAAMQRERLKSKTVLANPTGAEAKKGKTAPKKVKLSK